MEESPDQPLVNRGPRIPPTKLSSIQPQPTLSIFYKKDRNTPVELLDNNLSKDAAIIFCDRIRRDLMDNNAKSFTIRGGSIQGFKDVLNWIKECVQESRIVHFKTIDEDTPNLFTQYANAIEAAEYLGVPSRDFAEGLTKRLMGISRKVLMTWDEVDSFYNRYSNVGLEDVAAASIFFAWWNGKLDENDTPEEMMYLDLLRKSHPVLDQVLHHWCETNEEEVRKKWAEKKEKKYATNANADFISGTETYTESQSMQNTDDGGWGNSNQQLSSSGGWDDHDTLSTSNATTANVSVSNGQSDWGKEGTSLETVVESWEENETKPQAADKHHEWNGDSALADVGNKSWADEVNWLSK